MTVHVHIADDHAVFRSGLRALLEKEEDVEIVGETGTGPDTVRAVTEHPADVLVLDLSMPGLSGPRVAESILAKSPRQAIVVLTMHEEEYYLQELLKIGVRGFVLKKSTGTELLLAIRAVHAGDQYVDSSLANHVISCYVGRKPDCASEGRLGALTPREQEVCRLIAYGHTNLEIAGKLSISDRTVETHRANIMSKLDLKSRAELVRFALDHGLIETD
jgi:two-component system response regulator NreC